MQMGRAKSQPAECRLLETTNGSRPVKKMNIWVYTMASNRYCIYLLVYVGLALLLVLWLFRTHPWHTEGFSSFNRCMEQGYPADFCFRAPAEMPSARVTLPCRQGRICSQLRKRGPAPYKPVLAAAPVR